jgi:hypothetical protein
MYKHLLTLLFVISLSYNPVQAQQSKKNLTITHDKGEGQGIKVAVVIGHTYIQSEGMNNHLYIPSWGLDIDYWFNHKWGIGLHNDIEVENFVVVKSDTEEIERINPLVFTLDALYHISNGFILSLGPGIELEENESFFLGRIGIEFEYDMNDMFYMMPTLFYDFRLDGFSTTTLGLGIGYKF